MIIDIHVHMPREYRGDENSPDQVYPAVERLLEAGRRAGIDKQVFLGLGANWGLKQVADHYPEQIIPFLKGHCIDPHSPDELEEYVTKYGFKGLKIHEEMPEWPLAGLLAAYPLFLRAGELGVPVLIHSWHDEEGLETMVEDIIQTGHFPARLIGELGQRYPQTTFILAHVGGLWVKGFQAGQPYPNVYFDVCGFDPERGVVEKAVEILGAERVLFGSDAPGRNYAGQIAKVLYADISEADRRAILGGNAARLLNLGV